MKIKNNHKFFNNSECKYFPCHEASDTDSFNCLFCYCPLYFSEKKCGGNFRYSERTGVKICTDCNLPHMPEYYDVIVSKLKEAIQKDTDCLEKNI